jgi:hypothetical protein
MNAFKMTTAGLAILAHAMENYSMVYMWFNHDIVLTKANSSSFSTYWDVY